MKCDKLIRGGFSFCGVDIATLGLSYAPENENTYVYRPTDAEVHEESLDGHDGSYLYGTTKRAKEFVLRCYFEESAIDRGIMERIYHVFKVGKSGKLVFDRRPWCYYYATVTSLPHPELSNYLNGTITITMKAGYPFARSDELFSRPTDIMHDLVMRSTAMLESAEMETALPRSFSGISGRYPILLHNAGTEYAPVSIMIAGNAGSGVIIENLTTKQQCKIVAMDKAHTTTSDKYVYVDGINGTTKLITQDESSSSPAFIYHDSGYIQLAPAYPATRNIYVLPGESIDITLSNLLYDDVVGQYIFVANGWHKITEKMSDRKLRLDRQVTISKTTKTMITRMNNIVVRPIDNMDLTHISFHYKHTFA